MNESVSVVESGDDFLVNPKSFRFVETVDPSTGSFHPLSGLTVESLSKQPKMHAIMMLAHQGWTVGAPSSVDSYMHGSDKRFLGQWQKSRWYFICLCAAGTVLDKLPLVRGLPYINHWCGEQYHKGLFELTDSTQLAALIDIPENTTSIEDMDAQIGSLLGGVDLHAGRVRNSFWHWKAQLLLGRILLHASWLMICRCMCLQAVGVVTKVKQRLWSSL